MSGSVMAARLRRECQTDHSGMGDNSAICRGCLPMSALATLTKGNYQMTELEMMNELTWMREKMIRVKQLAADYVEALARHHVARNDENRMKLAGDCFNVRAKFDAVILETFQYSGNDKTDQATFLADFAIPTLQG